MKPSIFGLILAVLPACATLNHGTVDEKLAHDLAYVYPGAQDNLQVGDRVGFYRDRCGAEVGPEVLAILPFQIQVCTEQRLGGGTVIRILSDRTCLVDAEPGVAFSAGTLVVPEPASAAR